MSREVIVTFENSNGNQHTLVGGKQYQDQNFSSDYDKNILVVVTYEEKNLDHFTCTPYDSVKAYRDLYRLKPRPIVHVTAAEFVLFKESIEKATTLIKEAIVAYDTSVEKQNSGNIEVVPYSNYTNYYQDKEKYIGSGPFYKEVNTVLWDAVEYAFTIVKSQQSRATPDLLHLPDFSQKIDEIKRRVPIEFSIANNITRLLELVDNLYAAFTASKRTNGVERVLPVSTTSFALIPPTTDNILLTKSITKAREFITKATDAYNMIIEKETSQLPLSNLGLDTYKIDAETEKKTYDTLDSIYKPIHDILWSAVDYAFYVVDGRNKRGISTTIDESDYLRQFNESNVTLDESTKQAIIDVLTDVRTLYTSYITGKSTTDPIKNSKTKLTLENQEIERKRLEKQQIDKIFMLRKQKKELREQEKQYEIQKKELINKQQDLQKKRQQLVASPSTLSMSSPEIKEITTSIENVQKKIKNIKARLGKNNIENSNSNND